MPDGTILVVDDDEQIVNGVEIRLQAVGYRTITASDGFQGVKLSRELLPDAILMDVQMPGMDGLQALRELQADETTTRIPVVMLSASLRDRRTAIDAGAQFFLSKPYQSTRLFAALDAVLSGH